MHFEDLRIYKISAELEKGIHQIIESIPYHWEIPQVDQIRRSSASITANITEGFSRRFYPKDNIRFLTFALGSSDETQHHLAILYNKKCIGEGDFKTYSNQYKNLSIKILNFINFIRRKSQLQSI